MNPFSHYAKPFTTQPITGFQPIRNPIHHPIPRNDNPNTSPPFNSLGFQPTHHSDQNIAQRCPPPHDPYPNKRVRHSQESYTEVFQEGSTPVNQVRNAVKLEEQRQAQASVKGLDQGFTSMSPGFRKTQNNFSFGMQENTNWNNSIYHNAMNMMLLRQHFSRTRKDALSRESPQSPSQPNFQNDGGYSTAGNNVNMASLLQNNMNITSPHGADLIRQIDAYNMMLLYQQHLVNQQLLYNLQDPSGKGNLNLKNGNNEPSSPLMRIPPLVGQNFLEYMSGSPLAVNNINALLRSEIRDKTILNDANLEELQKLSLNQAVEALSRTSKAVETGGQEDQKENRPPDSKFVVNDGKMKQENVCNNIVLQSSEDNRLSTAAESPSERLKNQKRKTSLTQKVGTVSETKRDSGLRRKNKWQMMIDTNEECSSEGSPEVNSSNKARMSTKSDQSTKPNLRGSSAFRKLSIPANRVQDEFQDKTRAKKTRYESSSHRKKKAMKAAAKIKAEAESLQNKLNLIVASRLEFDNAEEDNNHISIAGSLGKNPEDFVLDEKDQHIMETRVGKDYQAKDLELDLNPASLAATKRIVSLAWDPEYFERELLEGYFAKLQSVLSCTKINEEKAIKMLLKKNMVQEEVIVTIKKNEKFYSTFLGPSHPPKNVKNKKNSEDRK